MCPRSRGLMKMLTMNAENYQPQKITQDVLVLSAKNDHFIPIKMHKRTMKSLKKRQINQRNNIFKRDKCK